MANALMMVVAVITIVRNIYPVRRRILRMRLPAVQTVQMITVHVLLVETPLIVRLCVQTIRRLRLMLI